MKTSRFNKFGVFSLLLLIATIGSSCSYYNRIMARMNLVDGAQAYNARNFEEATEKFRKAVQYDPEGITIESKTAQLFLARTLHSLFAGNRRDKQKAEQAVEEYIKALPGFVREISDNRAVVDASPEDENARKTLAKNERIVSSIVSAVGSLYENLQQDDKWRDWQIKKSEDVALPNKVRANSLVALAAKKYTCANEISDTAEVKKSVQKGGESVYQFSKPKNEDDFDKLKKCVEEGTAYVDKAIELSSESDSAWSYRTSLLSQKMRIAEMDGKTEEKASLEKQQDEARAKFEELATKKRKDQEEAEAKKKAEEGKKNGDKNSSNDK